MTFTSNKSMEIEVLVDAHPVVDNSQERYRAASAFFTYVSLSQDGRSLPVPQLVVSGTLAAPWLPGETGSRGPVLGIWAPAQPHPELATLAVVPVRLRALRTVGWDPADR